jgi:hypothetical protein
MPAKDAEHRREYMRWYMAQKRKAAKTSKPATRKPVGIGPPCPANLPDRPIGSRQYAGQVELLKVQLAHTLSLWQESCEELALQVEVLTVENEALQAQNEALQAPSTNLQASSGSLQAPSTNLQASNSATKVQNLPPPALAPSKPLADEVDQYLRDKSQGLVDPNRLPKGADDAIDF